MIKLLLTLILACLPLTASADWFSTPVLGDDTTIEKSAGKLRVKDGGISAAKLATNAVTTVKITDSNVTTAKIADSNVTTAKIADSNVTAAKVTALIGTAVSKSDATNYQATTDGYFCGVITCGTSSINVGKITVYSDSTATPTTIVNAANCSVHADSVSQTATGNVGGFCHPIKKNEYYRGELTSVNSGGGSTGASATYSFIPLGN